MLLLTTRIHAQADGVSPRLHRYGGIWPITESSTGDPVTTVDLAGHSWDLYTGWNGDMRVYSFLPENDEMISSFSADVKVFFDYLEAEYDFPVDEQYMLSKLCFYSTLHGVICFIRRELQQYSSCLPLLCEACTD